MVHVKNKGKGDKVEERAMAAEDRAEGSANNFVIGTLERFFYR